MLESTNIPRFQKAYSLYYRVLGIRDKLVKLIKVKMPNSKYHVKIGSDTTDGFEYGMG